MTNNPTFRGVKRGSFFQLGNSNENSTCYVYNSSVSSLITHRRESLRSRPWTRKSIHFGPSKLERNTNKQTKTLRAADRCHFTAIPNNRRSLNLSQYFKLSRFIGLRSKSEMRHLSLAFWHTWHVPKWRPIRAINWFLSQFSSNISLETKKKF